MSTGVSQRIRRAAMRAQGLCGCGREREPDSRMCKGCSRSRRDDVARSRADSAGGVWLSCCENFTHYPGCRR